MKSREGRELKQSNGKNGKPYVILYRGGKRRKYIDDNGQEWVRFKGEWWKFPQEIEY